jgi:hypothetical protein
MTEPELEWTYSSPRASLYRKIVALGVAIVASLWATYLLRAWFSGFLGFFLVFGFVSDLFFVTRFKLDAVGAHSRSFLSASTLEWKNVRRVVVEGDQILLSPLARASVLDAFRGVTLKCMRNKAQVLEMIKHYTGVEWVESEQIFAR